ncbi:MAG TPA: MgtC/SapB family protein [Steroidobacteraceae bacterium]|nr:MgtC/SapB family protein [Steroidobacteraceae bacterium]
MELILRELGGLPDLPTFLRFLTRMLAALALGALIGYQRERSGKAAGLRTHMLVALGTSLFVIVALESGMRDDATSRVIQGVITGIGFLGAGSILKIREDKVIHGLTTAAGIWMTAAASVAIGLGQILTGLLAGVLAWLVLAVMSRFERRGLRGAANKDP